MGYLAGPAVRNPQMTARLVGAAAPVVQHKGWLAKAVDRFLEDCRDFMLWLKGKQPSDGNLFYEMQAELAKVQLQEIDWDAWEAERFAAHPNAVWFDPDRYKDTPYDWPKKVEAPKQIYDARTDQMIKLASYQNNIGSLAQLQNAAAAQGLMNSGYSQSQLAMMHQAQFGITNMRNHPLIFAKERF